MSRSTSPSCSTGESGTSPPSETDGVHIANAVVGVAVRGWKSASFTHDVAASASSWESASDPTWDAFGV